MKVILLACLVFMIAAAAAPAAPLQLVSKDLPGWAIAPPDRYSATQLYGYINGGAEIYLEYGFKQVLAQRCTRNKHEFQVDIYEMTTPRAAFGMFSTLRGRCTPGLPGVTWHCVSPEQILFTRGNYLVSIVPYDRAAETRTAATAAAKALIGRIRGHDFRVPAPFGGAPFSNSQKTLRFIQGPLALQGVLGEWTPWLEKISRFDMFHVTVGDGARRTEAAVIAFRARRDAERFLTQGGMEKIAAAKGWRIDTRRELAVRLKGDRTVHVLWGGQFESLRDSWK